LLHAREFTALILGVIRVVLRLMHRWSCGIVEPIHHQKVDHLVPPVRGRRKRPARLTSSRLRAIQDCLDFRGEQRCEHNTLRFCRNFVFLTYQRQSSSGLERRSDYDVRSIAVQKNSVHYSFVQIMGRCVIYFGRQGESYVEHFPPAPAS